MLRPKHTLLPRSEHSLGSIGEWVKVAGGKVISISYTLRSARVIWLAPVTENTAPVPAESSPSAAQAYVPRGRLFTSFSELTV